MTTNGFRVNFVYYSVYFCASCTRFISNDFFKYYGSHGNDVLRFIQMPLHTVADDVSIWAKAGKKTVSSEES